MLCEYVCLKLEVVMEIVNTKCIQWLSLSFIWHWQLW